jgi:hypothetical protein
MKQLIAIMFLSMSSLLAFSADFYADVYRFGDINHTGTVGIQEDHWGAEFLSESGSGLSITNRQYLEFTNIEIGVSFELSNGHQDDALDYRVIDIEGGWYFMNHPYIKVGSELFAIVKLDESNSPVISVGFKIF